MSELLRLATKLLDEETRDGGWPCHGKYPCLYTNEVLALIKGYQDLIRRMADMLDACADYGHGIWIEKIEPLVVEAKASIPEQ